MLSGKEQKLLDVLEGRAAQEGVEIVTVEIVGTRRAPLLRVFIDTDHGVSFDDLSSAQAWVSEIIEGLDPFPGSYTLEVSSPGIDRPLRTPAQFKRFVGECVVLKTKEPIENRSNFTGTLEKASDDAVSVACEKKSYCIEYDQIKRAHLKGKIEF